MEPLKSFIRTYYWVYAFVLLSFAAMAIFTSKTVETISMTQIEHGCTTVVLDAGHGGEDGGATSCTGTLESQINLEITHRLNDLLHLLGYKTRMIRTTDDSVSTTGDTIGARKLSDLKNRVQIVNKEKQAVLISIHQNTFSDGRYDGAQVFYAPTKGSHDLADSLQHLLIQTLNPNSKRAIKPADGIYFMQNIRCAGILVECGFLSNQREAKLLENAKYQKRLVCVISSSLNNYLNP